MLHRKFDLFLGWHSLVVYITYIDRINQRGSLSITSGYEPGEQQPSDQQLAIGTTPERLTHMKELPYSISTIMSDEGKTAQIPTTSPSSQKTKKAQSIIGSSISPSVITYVQGMMDPVMMWKELEDRYNPKS
jgi:hypothetical protein